MIISNVAAVYVLLHVNNIVVIISLTRAMKLLPLKTKYTYICALFQLSENTNTETGIITVYAADGDSDIDGEVTYSITGIVHDIRLFSSTL